ncbi:hypothetical protein M569_14454 [Genlisea aurea]|uniref:Glucose-methanol-choline oxidoreductase N-terminal domain-containing protein n=1 Tax=Genlisea aurea TaxID=192259 RepID=S8DC68_9LAMI|nr:hypothetical protein M569_14454 [Genlisea aurea]
MGFEFWRFFIAAFIVLFNPIASQRQGADPGYKFLHHATSAPSVSYYDYIVIGGGTAGCPLAATLSEKSFVLLLERGGSPYENPNITFPSGFGRPLADLSHSSPSQRFISEDGVINARARVLGGGSCINAGFYSRASADYIAAAGFDGKLVNESYGWVEKLVAFEPLMEHWQTAVRDGLLEAGVGPDNGYTFDHLIGTKIGGTLFDAEGRRHTAADLLKYADPAKLTVLLHASVHKILFILKEGKSPVANGVVFIDGFGKLHKAYLNGGPKNEIILSAGAIGSPQLLILSGVGPLGQLKAHNITKVLDQPFVGQGMSDNPMNAVFVPSPIPVEISLIQAVGITPFGSYIEAASGEFFVGGWLQDHLTSTSDKVGGIWYSQDAEDINPPDGGGGGGIQGGFVLEKIMGPLSKGYLELKNKNPNDNPSVTFNYFSHPVDVQRCVEGLKVMTSVLESKAFSPFKYRDMNVSLLLDIVASAPINLRAKHPNTTTSLEQFCKDTVMTIWHYHGGCEVGKVVDSDYKVMGVDRLRVIDGSTFSESPGTNPQATVMMLGRYMGVKILRGRSH